MDFNKFNSKLQKHVQALLKDQSVLFEADLDKDQLWNLYLDSFPAGTNEIFRKRREYDCSCCRNFIKNFGHILIVKNNKVNTIWDFDAGEFAPVAKALHNFVKSKNIANVFLPMSCSFGTAKSLDSEKVIVWEHFNLKIDDKFKFTGRKDTIGTVLSNYRTNKDVFKRSLEELTEDSIITVNELIAQNSLYKGEEWKSVLQKFLNIQKEYNKLSSDKDKDAFCWTNSIAEGPVISRIKNHSIGVLLQDISSGTDLDDAVRKYESIVAPSNYKRPKAIFTKKMVEDAEKMLTNEGLLESLPRRFARIQDITINNILFANRNVKAKIAPSSVFDDLKKETKFNPKSLGKVEEVSIEKFVTDILPNATSLEVLFEGRHSQNLVSLIAPKIKESKPLFKWDNGFSWAYNGNITDSMKERVKSAGGKVDGVLRFSIQWNTNGDNPNDYDAHCIEPNGNEIFFGAKVNWVTKGNLDVDIIHPGKDQVAVENITWPDLKKMRDGTYKFFVNNYSHRGGRSGFTAEIEFNGELYSFDYNKDLKAHGNVEVALVELKDGNFKIVRSLDSTMSGREIWGLKSGEFHNVNVCMYSPNYWDERGVGNRHYFFMLANCKNDMCPNGFFNEFIKEDYMKHKRVFEALGSKMSVEPDDDQLSGIGFSSTKRNNVIVKVGGAFTRILSVKI